jgi:hypothetical protein
MNYLEHKLQAECIKWFKYQYPHFAGLIFHIPNERKQSPQAGARAKAIGTLAGVADVFLSTPNETYHGCYFEFKASTKNKQTENQKTFEKNVISVGYDYVLISDFDTFRKYVNNYLLIRQTLLK